MYLICELLIISLQMIIYDKYMWLMLWVCMHTYIRI